MLMRALSASLSSRARSNFVPDLSREKDQLVPWEKLKSQIVFPPLLLKWSSVFTSSAFSGESEQGIFIAL